MRLGAPGRSTQPWPASMDIDTDNRHSYNTVIVVVGSSIVLNQLGISFSGTSSSVRPGSPQPQGGAPGQPARASGGGKRTFAVRSLTISTGLVSNYTQIHGDAVSNNETKIYPNVGGKLLERQVSVGDQIVKGTTIALVDPSKVGETYMPNPVESTVSGTILSIPVHEGACPGRQGRDGRQRLDRQRRQRQDSQRRSG